MKVAVAVAVAAVALVLAVAPGARAADATRMTGVDAQHLNAVPDSPLRPPLRLRWSLDTTRIPWRVLVDGGRVLTLEQVPGQDSYVVAREVAGGQQLWSRVYAFPLHEEISFATDAGRVFVAAALADPEVLRVDALDAATGALVWSRDLPAPQGLGSEVTVDGGAVYLLADTYGTTAHALRQGDGSTIWQTPNLASGHSTPAVDATRVYLSLGGGQSYALDRATGAVQWHHDTGISGGGGTDPVLWGGRLYGDSGLVLDPATGGKLASWRGEGLSAAGDLGIEPSDTGARSFGPAYESTRWSTSHRARLIVGDHAYGGDSGDSGIHIFSVRLADGTGDWCHPLSGPQVPGYSRGAAPAAAGDGVLVATAGTQLAAFENGGGGSNGCVVTSAGPQSDPPPATGSGAGFPPPGAGPGIALQVGRKALFLGERTNLTGRVSGVPITSATRVLVDLDEFPYSDSGFKRSSSARVNPDGTFAFKFAPRRNSRLRARLAGADLTSPAVEVLADFPYRARVLDRGGRRPRLRYTVFAFRKARARRKVVHAYVTRGRSAPWRRVDSRRASRLTSSSATWVLRYPRGRLGRGDRWMVCWREPRPDGFGPVLEVDRRCGARTLARDLF